MKRIVCITVLVVMLVGVLACCSYGTPEPEIEEAEFKFSVTYEFEGKVKTLSGVYVCEYEGVDWALDGGPHRSWSGYIKDSDMEEMICIGKGPDGGEIHLDFCFNPEYLMGDPEAYVEEIPKPTISVTMKNEGIYFLTEPQEVEEYCGAKIINYEYDEPIKNTFK